MENRSLGSGTVLGVHSPSPHRPGRFQGDPPLKILMAESLGFSKGAGEGDPA